MSANMREDFKADPVIVALTPVLDNVRKFAAGLIIRSADAYERAAAQLKSIKGALAQIEDSRTRITKPLNAALKETNDQAKAAALPFQQDETVIKNAMVRYSNEQEELRKAEQRRANEAAERERNRLQDIADRAAVKARLEAEEKRRQAEQEDAAGREAEAALLREQAERVEAKGLDKVEQFETRAASVVAPIATQAAPKVSGVSTREVWKFEITDPSKINPEFMVPDEVKMRKLVLAMKGEASALLGAGVRVYSEKQLASGTA